MMGHRRSKAHRRQLETGLVIQRLTRLCETLRWLTAIKKAGIHMHNTGTESPTSKARLGATHIYIRFVRDIIRTITNDTYKLAHFIDILLP